MRERERKRKPGENGMMGLGEFGKIEEWRRWKDENRIEEILVGERENIRVSMRERQE